MTVPGADPADVAEQDLPLVDEPAGAVDLPLEADVADAVEQSLAVPFDEEDGAR